MKLTAIQKAIAADRIRRERARAESEAHLRQTFRDGVLSGRREAQSMKMPEPMLNEVFRRAAHIMAYNAVEQHREKSPATVHVLASIVQSAVEEFPYDLRAAREVAEYRLEDYGVRFDFRIENVQAAQIISFQDIERFYGDKVRMVRP